MHSKVLSGLLLFNVPNAPCGVESFLLCGLWICLVWVPNAPCGVERRSKSFPTAVVYGSFLMHRVELKEGPFHSAAN